MAKDVHTLEVWGDLACFTRPEMKVERFSYPVITPSAARGIFDAIYWDGQRQGAEIRPYFHWQITRIEILELPRYIALRRNEVKGRVPGNTTLNQWMNGSAEPEPLWADGGEEATGRTQRQTMALKNVRYRLTAHMVPKSGQAWGKINASFVRRARGGKCFQQPYLGCREFPAFFEYIDDPIARPAHPVPLDQHLGLILYDVFDLRKDVIKDNDKAFVTLFDAHVLRGVLEVPAFDHAAVIKPER
jgi:CRISPR-associated protein Cas5d